MKIWLKIIVDFSRDHSRNRVDSRNPRILRHVRHGCLRVTSCIVQQRLPIVRCASYRILYTHHSNRTCLLPHSTKLQPYVEEIIVCSVIQHELVLGKTTWAPMHSWEAKSAQSIWCVSDPCCPDSDSREREVSFQYARLP